MKKEFYPIYLSEKELKNVFWVVYNKKVRVVSISKDKRTAQEEALKLSNHRWTDQTFKKDWGYLLSDGYTIEKSAVITLKELEEEINQATTSAYWEDKD